MNEMLRLFLESTKQVNNKNIRKQDERNKQRELEIKEKEALMLVENKKTLVYDENLPSVKRIKELGFQINSYHQEEHPYGSEYYGDMDVFYCTYKDWVFAVEWSMDPDIEEGILAMREPRNIVTGEKMDFYCDLFCNNTSEGRLENVLKVFEIGYGEFIQQEYGKYIELPILLKEKGVSIRTENYEFTIGDNDGYIDVGDGVYIRVFGIFWSKGIALVVTNNKRWDINSYNGGNYGNEIGYYFDYQGVEDLDELCQCIEATKRHVKGQYGYKEMFVQHLYDGTSYKEERYFKGEDFLSIFKEIEDKLKSKYYDKWNSRFIDITEYKNWSGSIELDDSKDVNCYKGLEIAKTIKFSINNATQWMVDNELIQYLIHFEYDKRKNDKECYLEITQWIGNEENKMRMEYEETEVDKTNPSYQGAYKRYGKFSELTAELTDFLYENLKIHGVEL